MQKNSSFFAKMFKKKQKSAKGHENAKNQKSHSFFKEVPLTISEFIPNRRSDLKPTNIELEPLNNTHTLISDLISEGSLNIKNIAKDIISRKA